MFALSAHTYMYRRRACRRRCTGNYLSFIRINPRAISKEVEGGTESRRIGSRRKRDDGRDRMGVVSEGSGFREKRESLGNVFVA